MKSNSVSIEASAEIQKKDSPGRFLIFVARGVRPLLSFSDFSRAERLAVIFARLTRAQMEVFDSEKDVCYYIEPNNPEASLSLSKILPDLEGKKIKAAGKNA